MNPYLKDMKIEKFPKDKSSSSKKFSENMAREFTVEDFIEAMKNNPMNLYDKIVYGIIDEQTKIMDKIICDSFKDYLGCKSGEDMYIILTSVDHFFKYNSIVKLINEHLKSTMMGFGPDGLVPQVSELSEPIKESDELKDKLINVWRDTYGKDN